MPATPIPFRPLTPDDLDPKKDPTLSYLNEVIRSMTNQINLGSGALGPIPIMGDLNLNGNRITNVGDAQEETDVLTQSSADPMYSTPVQQSAMEAVGTKMLQTTRRLNDATQQHKISSDLNTQGSIPPTNLVGALTWTSTASSVTWTWTGIIIQFADLTYLAIKDDSLVVTGLAATGYYFYPYYDTVTGRLTFVANSTFGAGSPPVAFNGSAAVKSAQAQAQNGDTRIALTANPGGQLTAPSSSGSALLRARP
jgi:hypothetical protein